jgi:predicted dehydrogenase
VSGIGDITSKRAIPAILAEPSSELRAVVTRDPKKAEPYACRVHTSFEEAIAQPDIDAVYVATPVVMHAPQSIAALRAGKHVLCEKPVAMNYREAVSMVEAAGQSGRTLGIAYYRRMYPKVRRAKELIEEGAIGRPVFAECNCHSWFQDEDGRRSWLLDPAWSGGGPLLDIASHRIDLYNFLFGRPLRVTGQVSNVVHPPKVEDSATVMIEYESLVRGVVDVRWHSRRERDDFRIIGTDGEIVLSPLSGPNLDYPGGRLELPRHANLHYPCVENFTHALLGSAELQATGASSIWTDWVTERALEADRNQMKQPPPR